MTQSEYTLYSCLNVKEPFAQSRRKIWSISNFHCTQTHNHLLHKQTLNQLAKLAKRLSFFVSTYQYGAFDHMFLSCQVRNSKCFTLYCCLNLKKHLPWSRRGIRSRNNCNETWIHNHFVHKTILNHLEKLFCQIIKLYCKYLSARFVWLYVFIMPRTRLRVYPHSAVAWISRKFSPEGGAKSEV